MSACSPSLRSMSFCGRFRRVVTHRHPYAPAPTASNAAANAIITPHQCDGFPAGSEMFTGGDGVVTGAGSGAGRGRTGTCWIGWINNERRYTARRITPTGINWRMRNRRNSGERIMPITPTTPVAMTRTRTMMRKTSMNEVAGAVNSGLTFTGGLCCACGNGFPG